MLRSFNVTGKFLVLAGGLVYKGEQSINQTAPTESLS